MAYSLKQVYSTWQDQPDSLNDFFKNEKNTLSKSVRYLSIYMTFTTSTSSNQLYEDYIYLYRKFKTWLVSSEK